jgi:hypothetical protein
MSSKRGSESKRKTEGGGAEGIVGSPALANVQLRHTLMGGETTKPKLNPILGSCFGLVFPPTFNFVYRFSYLTNVQLRQSLMGAEITKPRLSKPELNPSLGLILGLVIPPNFNSVIASSLEVTYQRNINK